VDENGILQAIALWKDKALFEQELEFLPSNTKQLKRTPSLGDNMQNLEILIPIFSFRANV